MPGSRRQALTALAALLLLAGCEANTAPAPTTVERPVRVQRVSFEDADAKREFVGVVRLESNEPESSEHEWIWAEVL